MKPKSNVRKLQPTRPRASSKSRSKARHSPIKLNLALQGGGAHGAFTWGVLDRLLEEDDLAIQGISGTSAGAMNGAVLVAGFARGGRAGAKAALEAFWADVSMAGMMMLPSMGVPAGLLQESFNLENSPLYAAFNYLTQTFSPYQLNPLNLNPLKEILMQHVDVDALRKPHGMQLFVTATAVRSGHARVFHCKELSVDALLASACIPTLFQAVEIDGEPYWDGGYMGNPVIYPLIYNTDVSDVLLVQINPLFREDTPRTAYEIVNRLNEISFNSSLISEMRAINFVSKLMHEHRLDPQKYRDVRMHMVAATFDIKQMDASSKMNPRWDFFLFLKEQGRERAEAWLKAHKKDIGHRASLNVQDDFLDAHKRLKNAATDSKDSQKRKRI